MSDSNVITPPEGLFGQLQALNILFIIIFAIVGFGMPVFWLLAAIFF